ncbi:phage tail protein [Lelliottia nimipressuralis]|uniref:phage tail protein n=1 Tax=Lelliottia nimipressuralis TaxID=69220 RepID=UPI00289670D9|nr:phage tail protein [Lelliottia nimipressuralis]
MTQLDSLYNYFIGCLPERLMKTTGADAWMDNIQLVRTSKALGLGQQLIGERRYDGVLGWDRWPYRDYSPDLIFALVNAWLDEFGNERRHQLGLGDPEPYVEIVDNQTAIITISVPLVDQIPMVPDEKGLIRYFGKRYSLKEPVIHTAQEAWIYGMGAPATVTGDEDEG